MLLIGGVQTLLFHLMLLRQLADDEKQHRRDHQHREAGRGDQIAWFVPANRPAPPMTVVVAMIDDREFGQCMSRGHRPSPSIALVMRIVPWSRL